MGSQIRDNIGVAKVFHCFNFRFDAIDLVAYEAIGIDLLHRYIGCLILVDWRQHLGFVDCTRPTLPDNAHVFPFHHCSTVRLLIGSIVGRRRRSSIYLSNYF